MKALHQTLMALTLVAVVTVAVGTLQPWHATAEVRHPVAQHNGAQHDAAQDPQAHFAFFADKLGLTDAQKEAIAGPFQEMAAALADLHRLHDAIAAELTDEQREELASMVHEALRDAMGAEHEGMHHQGDGHR